jgi:hypothetical protein
MNLLSMQPLPANMILTYYPPDKPTVTSITREWAGDEWRHCRLCPRDQCHVSAKGNCNVVIGRYVASKDAALCPLRKGTQ